MRQDLRQKEKEAPLLEVGFEPTHLAILELESSALDHSAIQATAEGGLTRDAQFTGMLEDWGKMEHQGFDPCTSRLQSGHSTN